MASKVLTNSIIYVTGDVLNKAIPFLMLPILTRYLTPSDYGMIAVFSAVVAFMSIFIGLSLHGAINVEFFKRGKESLRRYIVNAILIVLFSTLFVFIAILFLDTTISQRLSLDSKWLYLAILVALAQFLTLVNLTLWVAEQNPKAYSIYQFSQMFLITCLTIVFVVSFQLDWTGQVLAMAIGSIGFAMISLGILHKRDYLTFKYDKEDIKGLLAFGIPMIPHQLAGWIQTSGDKILLMVLVGSSATGIFAVGYQVAMIMTVLTVSFNKAWNPYLYKNLERKIYTSKVKIVKITYLYFIAISILFGILYFVSKLIFEYVLDERFLDSMEFAFYILLSNMFNGMYLMVSSYLFYTQETKKLAKITFLISILHVIMSYLFITYFGAIGIVYSGVISSFFIFISVWYVSSRVYKMPWSLKVKIDD